MTPDEHQRERMLVWSTIFRLGHEGYSAMEAGMRADVALAEFDKRFPAPSAAAPVEPDQSAMGMAVSSLILDQTNELASLRQKARLWDAVRDGRVYVRKMPDGRFDAYYGPPGLAKCTREHATPEEAVEAAIAAGATK